MEELVLEVGMLLDKDYDFYVKLMEKAGAVNCYNCETHDIYYTNKSFNELEAMTENQIKMSCIRFRTSNGFGGTCFSGDYKVRISVQNYKIYKDNAKDNFQIDEKEFSKLKKQLEDDGWYLIFDTFKVDYQYKIGDMQSALQFQEIDNIGLVLYYDNPEYYKFNAKRQREALLDELNSYGFEFKYEDLGIDKLKTLLIGESCFSENQNG